MSPKILLPTIALAALCLPAGAAPPERQIQVSAKVIQGPTAVFPTGATLNPDALKARLAEIAVKKGWDIMSAPAVVSREGQAAKIEVGKEVVLAAGADPGFVGISIELNCKSAPDGAIGAVAHCILTELEEEKGEPATLLTFEQKIEVLMIPGHTVALAVPTSDPDIFTTFLITPMWVDAAGK